MGQERASTAYPRVIRVLSASCQRVITGTLGLYIGGLLPIWSSVVGGLEAVLELVLELELDVACLESGARVVLPPGRAPFYTRR